MKRSPGNVKEAKDPKVKVKAADLGMTREEAEQLVASIQSIDLATKQILSAGLTKRALVVLLKDSTGVSIAEINKVLGGLSELSKDFLANWRQKR
jgi:hypothetical protein